MESIKKNGRIKETDLRSDHYFIDLMEEASTCSMLSYEEIQRIQVECLTLLAKKIECFNGDISSSVRVEIAKEILDSISFTVGNYLKTINCSDDAVEKLQNESIESLYKRGLTQIMVQIRKAKKLHLTILASLISTENEFYRITIEDEINEFFRLYNPIYSAQEIHIMPDYPVFIPVEKVVGIEFIQIYLEHIYYENMFCSYFAISDIHNLLFGFDECFQRLLFNIYEHVLLAALGCILSNCDFLRLTLTPSAVISLGHIFKEKNTNEITLILYKAVEKLSFTISMSESLKGYINRSLFELAKKVHNAIRTRNLDRVFIMSRIKSMSAVSFFPNEEKMSDILYRKVLNEFIQCRLIEDKISIINEQVHSLLDLEDLLLDAEPSKDEILDILDELSLSEVAFLSKKYQVQYEMNFSELRYCELHLCECLNDYVASLTNVQKKWVDKSIYSLTND